VIEKCLDSDCIGTQVDQIFDGTHPNEDLTIKKCLGKNAKKKMERVAFLV
jgi:hypothetical protein